MRISDWSSDVCSSDLEADPAQHRDAIDLEPGRPAQPARDAEFDRAPDAAENADLLAEEQPGGDAERQRREQLIDPEPADIDHGVGETQQSPEHEGHPGVQRTFATSERRRVAKESVSTCRTRWWRDNKQK